MEVCPRMKSIFKAKRTLWVVAHPDDEVLGGGGTLARLAENGVENYVIFMTNGEGSRSSSAEKIDERKACMNNALDLLNIKDFWQFDFPDNEMDTVPILDVVKKIESISQRLNPSYVFTHSRSDLNVDHQVVATASVTAHRPAHTQTTGVLAFEILSSTEWSFDSHKTFKPNYFVNITDQLEKKKQAMRCYNNELRAFPHPRTIGAIEAQARLRGSMIGVPYSEAFESYWVRE